MSGRIASEVYEYAPEDLRPAELTILVILALDARETDRIARHSDHESLAHLARLSTGTVRNALSELASRGLIILQRKTTYRGGSGFQEYLVTRLEPHHRTATKHVTPR